MCSANIGRFNIWDVLPEPGKEKCDSPATRALRTPAFAVGWPLAAGWLAFAERQAAAVEVRHHDPQPILANLFSRVPFGWLGPNR